MRKGRPRRTLRDGLDPIGPFHPYVVFAAILLLDLIAVFLLITALVWASDQVEDLLLPGGEEWIDL